ncbi:hypothetical protein [Microbacterium esteraromaticum]|uniref:hypothetical protein n=1 Tax=Microbacterium esteraromaticum TaxID=57043 RepID=UPI001C937753|nr:hypothetical protein [Microbacterium esteraromaticum]MBY6061015.1 hypothetical protein [Microbacterium esteraromaticum]
MEIGTAADWATFAATTFAVIAAGAALYYSHRANALSREIYREDVRVRNEAQARLVYARKQREIIYRKGQEIVADNDATMSETRGGLLGTTNETQSPGATRALEDLMVVEVVIHNDSKEVIGPFQVRLHDVIAGEPLTTSYGTEVVLAGKTSDPIQFAVPRFDGNYVPDISFRDSAGLCWSRRGYEPIQVLDEQRRRFFAELAGLQRFRG